MVMAAYPGEGYKMSNYGLKKYSPDQVKEQWKQAVHRQIKVSKFHAAIKTDLTTPLDTDISYFSNDKVYPEVLAYDLTFRYTEGYNSKLKRDDQEHTQGLTIHSEEVGKHVPVLSSSVYGHLPAIETPTREYVRVGVVQRDFYRSSGASVNPSA